MAKTALGARRRLIMCGYTFMFLCIMIVVNTGIYSLYSLNSESYNMKYMQALIVIRALMKDVLNSSPGSTDKVFKRWRLGQHVDSGFSEYAISSEPESEFFSASRYFDKNHQRGHDFTRHDQFSNSEAFDSAGKYFSASLPAFIDTPRLSGTSLDVNPSGSRKNDESSTRQDFIGVNDSPYNISTKDYIIFEGFNTPQYTEKNSSSRDLPSIKPEINSLQVQNLHIFRTESGPHEAGYDAALSNVSGIAGNETQKNNPLEFSSEITSWLSRSYWQSYTFPSKFPSVYLSVAFYNVLASLLNFLTLLSLCILLCFMYLLLLYARIAVLSSAILEATLRPIIIPSILTLLKYLRSVDPRIYYWMLKVCPIVVVVYVLQGRVISLIKKIANISHNVAVSTTLCLRLLFPLIVCIFIHLALIAVMGFNSATKFIVIVRDPLLHLGSVLVAIQWVRLFKFRSRGSQVSNSIEDVGSDARNGSKMNREDIASTVGAEKDDAKLIQSEADRDNQSYRRDGNNDKRKVPTLLGASLANYMSGRVNSRDLTESKSGDESKGRKTNRLITAKSDDMSVKAVLAEIAKYQHTMENTPEMYIGSLPSTDLRVRIWGREDSFLQVRFWVTVNALLGITRILKYLLRHVPGPLSVILCHLDSLLLFLAIGGIFTRSFISGFIFFDIARKLAKSINTFLYSLLGIYLLSPSSFIDHFHDQSSESSSFCRKQMIALSTTLPYVFQPNSTLYRYVLESTMEAEQRNLLGRNKQGFLSCWYRYPENLKTLAKRYDENSVSLSNGFSLPVMAAFQHALIIGKSICGPFLKGLPPWIVTLLAMASSLSPHFLVIFLPNSFAIVYLYLLVYIYPIVFSMRCIENVGPEEKKAIYWLLFDVLVTFSLPFVWGSIIFKLITRILPFPVLCKDSVIIPIWVLRIFLCTVGTIADSIVGYLSQARFQ